MLAEPLKEPPQVTTTHWRTQRKCRGEKPRPAAGTPGWAGAPGRSLQASLPSARPLPLTRSPGCSPSAERALSHPHVDAPGFPWMLSRGCCQMMRSWHLTKPSLSKAPFIQMDKKRISQALSSWQPHLWQSPQLTHSIAAVVNTHLQSSSGLTAKLSGKSRGAPHTHSPRRWMSTPGWDFGNKPWSSSSPPPKADRIFTLSSLHSFLFKERNQ